MKKINILDTVHLIGFLILIAIIALCSKGFLNPKSFSVQVVALSLFVALGVSMLCVLVKETFTQHYKTRYDKWVTYLATITVVYYFGFSLTARFMPDPIIEAGLVVLCILVAGFVITMCCGWVTYAWKRLRQIWVQPGSEKEPWQ